MYLKSTKFIQNSFYFFARFFIRAYMKLLFELEIVGLQNLNLNTNFVLAGNHTGFLDSLVIVSSVKKPVRFLVSEKVLKVPFLGLVLKIFGEISVKHGSGRIALEKAKQSLLNGEIICIFPEGKLTTDGNIGKFKKGIITLQKESNLPVIPFAIEGGFEAWGWQSSLRFRKISIIFGKPVTFNTNLNDDESINKLREEVVTLKKELVG